MVFLVKKETLVACDLYEVTRAFGWSCVGDKDQTRGGSSHNSSVVAHCSLQLIGVEHSTTCT
jgi:hypothetical protein